MITQPAVALAYCPEGHAVSTYTPFSAGMKGFKSATGEWLFLLDTAMPSGTIVVNTTAVLAVADNVTLTVSLGGVDTATGKISQFTVASLDSDAEDVDCGLMVTVIPIPDNN